MEFKILECKRFIAPSASSVIKRIVKDYELDFYVRGDRTVYIDGQRYFTRQNSLSFRRPGQEIYSFGDYDCYIMTMDFSLTADEKGYRRNAMGKQQPQVSHPCLDSLPSVFTSRHAAEIHQAFSALTAQSDKNNAIGHALAEEIIYLINGDVCREYIENHMAMPSPEETVMRYINKHYQEDITLERLGRLVNLEKSYLSRRFKAKFGSAPIQYLVETRLTQAGLFLINTTLTSEEIAYACGYHSASFFIRQFRERFGLSPQKYRENYTV